MIFDVVFYWKDLKERDLSRSAVIVADILRATTVIVKALHNGADAILPQDNDAVARLLFADLKEQGVPALLCGEKEGFKREGYDLGNSPGEFTREIVAGKTIVHLTTNGTRALKAGESARTVLLAAFSNRSAVADRLRRLSGEIDEMLFVVSGREGKYCIEDTVCLGGILAELLNPPGRDIDITDAALTAMNLYQVHSQDILQMLKTSYHGYYLEQVGLGADLPECARVDIYDIVPKMVEGRITL